MDQRSEQLRIYVAAAVIVVAIALLSLLVVPRGTQLQRCNSVLLGKSNCLDALAQSTGNYTICSRLPLGIANSCYYSIAQNTTNQSICTRISWEPEADACGYQIALATRNQDICTLLNSTSSPRCFLAIAQLKLNQSICSSISNQSYSDNCTNYIYLSLAASTANSTYCSKLPATGSTNLTYSLVANSNFSERLGVYQNMTQVLQYLYYNGDRNISPSDACYYSVAYASHNASYCSYISDSTSKSLCNYSTNQTAINTTTTQINATAFLNDCLNASIGAETCNQTYNIYLALQTKNATLCGKLEQQYSYECYADLAQALNQTSICGYITNATVNNACIDNIIYRNYTGPG